ncbi:unnamed protein product [Pleuronectes platessa]|uniref:Uncharacterized protein n=1 Tax=Pleuronectes platessa TaxID=8262 RepID=A0A9N7YC06_PLEPL|nr:unnamed protein product [Pleuronectes platessa]
MDAAFEGYVDCRGQTEMRRMMTPLRPAVCVRVCVWEALMGPQWVVLHENVRAEASRQQQQRNEQEEMEVEKLQRGSVGDSSALLLRIHLYICQLCLWPANLGNNNLTLQFRLLRTESSFPKL